MILKCNSKLLYICIYVRDMKYHHKFCLSTLIIHRYTTKHLTKKNIVLNSEFENMNCKQHVYIQSFVLTVEHHILILAYSSSPFFHFSIQIRHLY